MFQLIASFLGAWFGNFWRWCLWLSTAIANLASHAWFVVGVVASILYATLVNVFNAVALALSQAQQVIGLAASNAPSNPGTGGMSGMLSVANALFPLTELMGFLIAYSSIALAFVVYRAIKGWIPTVGN